MQQLWETLSEGLDDTQKEALRRLIRANMMFLTDMARVSSEAPEA